MIRFIDITEDYWLDSVHKGKVFSFLDTTDDHYITVGNNQAWGSKEDLLEDIKSDKNMSPLLEDRLIGLIPIDYERP